MIKKLVFALLAAVVMTGTASADLIVEYEGLAGTSQPGITGVLASSALDLTRGSGLGEGSGGVFNSNSFSSATLADAISANDFLSFGFTPAVSVDLTDIQVGIDRSGTGPTTVHLLSSIGGFTAGSEIASFAIPDPEDTVSFDLSSLTGVSTPTEFRFYFTGASSSVGTSSIESILTGSSGTVGLQVNGVATAAIPEPSSIALLGLCGLAGAVRRRK